jgi:hypothetical protein
MVGARKDSREKNERDEGMGDEAKSDAGERTDIEEKNGIDKRN